MRYTVDIPSNHKDFSRDYGDFEPISVPNVGVYAYVDSIALTKDMFRSAWSDGGIVRFSERLARNELDVLRLDGECIGWIVRDDPRSLQLLQRLNNLPVTV